MKDKMITLADELDSLDDPKYNDHSIKPDKLYTKQEIIEYDLLAIQNKVIYRHLFTESRAVYLGRTSRYKKLIKIHSIGNAKYSKDVKVLGEEMLKFMTKHKDDAMIYKLKRRNRGKDLVRIVSNLGNY